MRSKKKKKTLGPWTPPQPSPRRGWSFPRTPLLEERGRGEVKKSAWNVDASLAGFFCGGPLADHLLRGARPRYPTRPWPAWPAISRGGRRARSARPPVRSCPPYPHARRGKAPPSSPHAGASKAERWLILPAPLIHPVRSCPPHPHAQRGKAPPSSPHCSSQQNGFWLLVSHPQLRVSRKGGHVHWPVSRALDTA